VVQRLGRAGDAEQRQPGGVERGEEVGGNHPDHLVGEEDDRSASERRGGVPHGPQRGRGDVADQHVTDDPAAQRRCEGDHEGAEQVEVGQDGCGGPLDGEQQCRRQVDPCQPAVRRHLHESQKPGYADEKTRRQRNPGPGPAPDCGRRRSFMHRRASMQIVVSRWG
jgi:hypothetical protein